MPVLIDLEFWREKAGDPIAGLNDAKVKALRRLYGGHLTLNDMERKFYFELTGIMDLTTAKARNGGLYPDTSGPFDRVG